MDKRKIVQLISAVVYNADFRGFFKGTVSKSYGKNVCVPGLNCYSCPGAVSSCPLGALQNYISSGKFPFFVTGFLLLAGVLLGRTVCGFLCPFGLVQELLEKCGCGLKRLLKIQPYDKKKGTVLSEISRKATLFKYTVLLVPVTILPLFLFYKNGYSLPFFCAWLCPAGTLEAGIPLVLANEAVRESVTAVFTRKVLLLTGFVVWSFFVYRPFCRYVCPLGAVYSFFNKIALAGVTVDGKKCIDCGKCTAFCKMDVRAVNDRECIRCGDCIPVCPVGAISFAAFGKKMKKL